MRRLFIKSHYACFACRKSFKQSQLYTLEAPGRWPKAEAPLVRECPECGGPAHEMGKYFHAPKQSDAAGWRRTETLYRAGHFRRTQIHCHVHPEPQPPREPSAGDVLLGRIAANATRRARRARRGS